MKNIKVSIICLFIISLFTTITICSATSPVVDTTTEEPVGTVTLTINEKASTYDSFYEVVRDDVYYLVAEDMSVAFIWNTKHSYLPELNVSATQQNIPNEILENAENFFFIQTM